MTHLSILLELLHNAGESFDTVKEPPRHTNRDVPAAGSTWVETRCFSALFKPDGSIDSFFHST